MLLRIPRESKQLKDASMAIVVCDAIVGRMGSSVTFLHIFAFAMQHARARAHAHGSGFCAEELGSFPANRTATTRNARSQPRTECQSAAIHTIYWMN